MTAIEPNHAAALAVLAFAMALVLCLRGHIAIMRQIRERGMRT